jgi:peptide/nickel transport system substrate-binding protein
MRYQPVYSRRRALRALASGTVALSAAALAACGSDGSSSSSSSSTSSAGSSPAAGAAAPKQGGKLRVGSLQDVFNLNPFITAAGRDHHYLYQIYDALFAYKSDSLTPQPYLAQSSEVPSKTEIVLKLRQGVKFQDGTPLTAQVVVQNLNAVIDPATKSVQAGLLKPVKNIEAPDAQTVRINLNEPSAAIIDYLSYNPGLMQAPAALTGDAATKPVGAGPFALESRVQNDVTTLRKWDGYWDPDGRHLDEIELKVLSDGTTRVNALRAGQIDVAIVVPSQFAKTLESDPNIRLSQGNTLVHHLFYVQSQKAPFNDKRLRQAFSLAIDRKEIADKVFFGLATPAQGVLTPVQPAYDSNASIVRYDPQGAKQRLEAAGKGSGFEFQIVTQAVSPFKETTELIQAQVAKVGIKAQIQFLESAEFTSRLVKGEIEALYSQWAGAADPDFTFTNRFTPEGGYNANRHNFAEVNQMIARARETYDDQERTKLYRQADKYINGVDNDELALDIVTVYPIEIFGLRKNVQNFAFFGDGKLRTKSVGLA